MNNNLFNEMISGFVEAKKYRAGKKAKMRVSRVAFESVSMKPAEIRRVRTRLRFSQPEFADSFVLASELYEVGNKAPANHKVRHSDY
jgi:DNA-binding transcriptional regulator YiaG